MKDNNLFLVLSIINHRLVIEYTGKPYMKILEFNDLELQVDQLIRALERLKTENMSLHNKLTGCARERARLQEKNRKAAIKIKQVINQLKENLS